MPGNVGLARMLAARWLVDTCSITRPGGTTVTDSGGTVAADPETESGVPCRLVRSGTRAVIELFGEQAAAGADWMLSVARDAEIKPGWTAAFAGASYAISDVTEGQTGAAYTHALLRASAPIGRT